MGEGIWKGHPVNQSKDQFQSLDDYAQRLFRFGGGHDLGAARDFYFKVMDEAKAAVEARGQTFVSFANYDYLGLSRHPEVQQAGIDAIRTFGSGALASRLAGGERSVHRLLEQDLADFLGTETSLAMVSGFLTNETMISTFFLGRDLILCDELSHASILAGAKGTRAKSIAFRHNDLDHLDALLNEHRASHANCIIVVEGLYSMDGDIPDLGRLLAIKDRHHAWLMIDEAHSHGVLGHTGRGICEHAGEDPARVELIMGTLSKTFVTCGGFLAGSRAVIDVLRFALPGYMFSVGIAPTLAAMARQAIHLATQEAWRTQALAQKAHRLLTRAHAAGLNTGDAIGRGIVPIMFRTQEETVAASVRLMAAGIYAPPIMHGVPRNMPRIRMFVSAAHDDADIDRAVEILAHTPAG